MNFKDLQDCKKSLLLDCISGSNAYGLNTATSDIDKKGIFILPKQQLYSFDRTEQVANDTNDEVYFEIGRFIDLLIKNNPNILELLSTPPKCVTYRDPLMDLIKPEDFLSKLCLDTFAGYAMTQIKKARGLNKKINRPMDDERKSVLDFCYVIAQNGSVTLKQWLAEHRYPQEEFGLVDLDHFQNVYLMYHVSQLTEGYFRGVVSGQEADDVQLSSVPKGISHIAVMNFNKDAYSVYCREYREYREWEEKRNDARYQSTLSHGKSYDAKNMMHTFRLLNMAEEIATRGEVIVKRPDREFLLKVKAGRFEFDDLMQMVDDKMDAVKEVFAKSPLPDRPDAAKAEQVLVQLRESYYSRY